MSEPRAFDAAVIGGGFAGLSAAAALSAAGRRVLVVEARGKLGGRASTVVDRESGEPVDNGQHVLFGCYRETLAFLDTIGARDRVTIQPSLFIPFVAPNGARYDLRCADLPAPWNLASGLLRWGALDARDRLSAARFGLRLLTGMGEPRADETVDTWLARMKQTPRVRGWLWEPLAVAALNEATAIASAAMFAPVLHELFTGSRQSASLVLPRVPLSDLYAEPARGWLAARGSEIRLGRPARISVQDRGFTVRAGEEHVDVPAIICAIPWHGLATLFEPRVPPELEAAVLAAAAMRSVPIVTVNVWFDRPVMDVPFAGLIGRTAQWVFDRSALTAGGASHLSVITSAADDLAERADDAISSTIVRDLRESLPGAREAVVQRTLVVRERQATFSVRPGSPERPGEKTALDGFFFAGDWLATGLPGTIEGAVRSGHRAARLLCDRSSFITPK